MSRNRSKFSIKNNVDNLINIEVGKKMYVSGEKVLKSDVMKDIADYVGVGFDNINMVKRGVVTPSLPVAIKIAEYFDKKVEDIFKIEEDNE